MDYRTLIERVAEVCPLPSSVAYIMALTEDENASLERIADAIATDPALAAELLRMAASPAYASRFPVTDLRGAAARVGLSELREMVAAMSMLVAFRSEHELGVEVHNSAVLAGNLAAKMAERLEHESPRRVFLAGLLSEIGALACLAVDADGYTALRMHADNRFDLRAALERDRYGMPSWEIGAALLERNNLPDRITEAVSGHLRPGGDARAVAATWFARRATPAVVRACHTPGQPWVSEVFHVAEDIGVDITLDEVEVLALDACRTTTAAIRVARAS